MPCCSPAVSSCSVVAARCSPSIKLTPPLKSVTVEYEVPLLKADGTMDKLTVEDAHPELGVRVVFCKEMPGGLICLTDEGGKQGWLQIPAVQDVPQSSEAPRTHSDKWT